MASELHREPSRVRAATPSSESRRACETYSSNWSVMEEVVSLLLSFTMLILGQRWNVAEAVDSESSWTLEGARIVPEPSYRAIIHTYIISRQSLVHGNDHGSPRAPAGHHSHG